MDAPGALRAYRFVLLALVAALPLAIVGVLRGLPPLDLAAAGLSWVAPLGAGALLIAASVGALANLVAGLRRGRLSRIAGAGASAAVAGGALGLLAGASSLAVALAGAALLALVASLVERPGILVRGRGSRLAAAMVVLLAAEAFALVEILPATAIAAGSLRDPVLGAAALIALLSAAFSFDREQAWPSIALAVAALSLVAARNDGVELLVGLALLAGGQLLGLRALARIRTAPDTTTDDDRLPELASRLADAVLHFDGRLQLRDWNPVAAGLLGLDPASHGGRLEDLLGVSISDLPLRDRSAKVSGSVGGLEIEMHRLDGGLTAVIRDPGAVPDVGRLGRELRGTIEELLQARRTIDLQRAELERASAVDALTGVASRGAILDRLRVEVAQARRYRHPVAVALLDVDSFADLNAAHGVAGGDAILREVALRMRLRVREADALGRAGSDGFLAILPHTDEGGAATFADALRHRLALRPILVGNSLVEITVSVGVSVMQAGEQLDPDALLARVGDALASARRAGGDRIALDRLHGLARLDDRRPREVTSDETAQDSGS